MSRLTIAAAAFGASLLAASSAFAGDPSPPSQAPAAPAAAAPEPNVRAALAVGALTMLIPGIVGGTRAAIGADPGQKTAGLLVASGGFALAPIFSHMVTREWGRAAAFGAIPIATTIAASIFIHEMPGAVYQGDMASRTAFGVLLGVGMLDAVLGLADTALAGERARDRRKTSSRGYFVVPTFGPGTATLLFGGAL